MSLPQPEAGLVVSYAYLWRREREQGAVEGRKNRPCAVVLVVQTSDGAERVTVAPITHATPLDATCAIEIPPAVKRHLGLDSERSWVMLDEFNQFQWPGFDLRPIPGQRDTFAFGVLPPAFFERLVRRILELRREGRAFVSTRDES